jgi:hypothetical protein
MDEKLSQSGQPDLTRSREKIVVMSPMGFPPQITQRGMAPRLDSLEGKTIYLVDLHFYDSGPFLSEMQAWLNENLPGVQTRLVQKSGQMAEDDPQLFAEIKATGDAMIMAVGH